MPAEPSERRKIYLKRKKSGCCPRCGEKIKKNSKYKHCEACREFFRNYNREISERLSKNRRMQYSNRKKKNCCPRCGKPLGKKYDKIICPVCLEKQYNYNYGKKRTKKSPKKK
jgi:uncharacterized Zn finger protein (UPF0148 family)